nr:hypothetical protein HK105_003171 [Polyrhizophydium stewartii]
MPSAFGATAPPGVGMGLALSPLSHAAGGASAAGPAAAGPGGVGSLSSSIHTFTSGTATTAAAAAPVSSAATAAATTHGPTNWEALRKAARQLEYEIDARLVQYSRIAASSTAAGGTPGPSLGLGGGMGAGAAGAAGLAAAQGAEAELDELLKQLTTTIAAMTAHLEGAGSLHPSLASMSHLLQRHRANLFEYNKEFQKTKQASSATLTAHSFVLDKANIVSKREHVELLSSIHNDIHSYRAGSAGAQDYFLTERGRMENTHSIADEILQQAMDAREDFDRQRNTLFGTRVRIASTLSRFPQLNSVLVKINSRKTRDTWIMGVVLGVGGSLLMWYALG